MFYERLNFITTHNIIHIFLWSNGFIKHIREIIFGLAKLTTTTKKGKKFGGIIGLHWKNVLATEQNLSIIFYNLKSFGFKILAAIKIRAKLMKLILLKKTLKILNEIIFLKLEIMLPI